MCTCRLLHAGNVGSACHATLITVAIAVVVVVAVGVAVAKCVAWRGAAWHDTKSNREKVLKRMIGIL